MDRVSPSGNAASGEFLYSPNLTDIRTPWTETRAVLGKGETAVRDALEAIAAALPFRLLGIDSDNGSEFINRHRGRWCARRHIQFTRGRPYKKDDNAHIEQKNWTHVRKLMGWNRCDTPEAVEAMNDLYRHELRLWMNRFLLSVKLIRKVRVGSRLRRLYGPAQTPLDRLLASPGVDRERLAELQTLRQRLDPFALAQIIDRKLEQIHALANRRLSPKSPAPSVTFYMARHLQPKVTFLNGLIGGPKEAWETGCVNDSRQSALLTPRKYEWGNRAAPPWFFSVAVAHGLPLGIGPHRKSGVIRKPLLPVDSVCPCTSKYHCPG